jgi:biotin synthase-related radical SAM superfamily protein
LDTKQFQNAKLTENSNLNLNTIALEEDAIQLKGVEIVSEKSSIEQKIDRKVINVGKILFLLAQLPQKS